MSKYDKSRYNQLRRLTIETISIMGSYSETAVDAIMMIIAHESMKGTLREQVISGDSVDDMNYKLSGADYGRGICQVEKFTHDDLWQHSDRIRADFYNVFGVHLTNVEMESEHRLVYDDKYSIFMARKKLHMITEKIPSDYVVMADYLVKYYNAGGKATQSSYLDSFIDWKGY